MKSLANDIYHRHNNVTMCFRSNSASKAERVAIYCAGSQHSGVFHVCVRGEAARCGMNHDALHVTVGTAEPMALRHQRVLCFNKIETAGTNTT